MNWCYVAMYLDDVRCVRIVCRRGGPRRTQHCESRVGRKQELVLPAHVAVGHIVHMLASALRIGFPLNDIHTSGYKSENRIMP